MKRAIGLAAAASSLFMTGEALAQSSPECAPVYEEASPETVSSRLESIISDYADNGVDIHVQILEDGEDEGITREGNEGYQQAIEYREDLTVSCGWSNPNMINVVLSQHPRVYEIYREGSVDTSGVTSSVNGDESSFIADLRDSDTPLQDDIAKMLTDISPFRPHTASTGNESSDNGGGGEPIDLPNVPWGPLGIGLAGAAVLGASGARIVRGSTLKREKNSILDGPEELHTQASDVLLNVYSILKELPDDDATQLRERYAELLPSISQFTSTKEGLDQVYQSERLRIWPDVYALQEIAQPLLDSIEEAENNLRELEAEAGEVKERMHSIDSIISNYQVLLGNTTNEADKLADAGWELGEIPSSRLGAFRDTLVELGELRKQKYVDKPGDIANEASMRLEDLSKEVKNLPIRLEAATFQITTAQELVTNDLPATVKSAQTTLHGLKEDYHSECTEDMAQDGEELHNHLMELQTVAGELAKLKGEKSVDKLVESEELLIKFNSLEQSVRETQSNIDTRKATLLMITEEIPSKLQQTTAGIDTADSETEISPDDVEQDTKSAVGDLERELHEFKEAELNSDKPRLLTIDNWFDSFDAKVGDLTSRARSERQEMVSLREYIESGNSSVDRAYANVSSLVSRNSDVSRQTELLLNRIDVEHFSTEGNRGDLRARKSAIDNLEAEIASVLQEAQNDIDRAEEEREREAQRRRDEQAERDRQAAAAAARLRDLSTPSYSPSPSPIDFGGGGGGGDGGSSSGGTW